MAFSKKFYFPTNRLEAFQFDRALAFTRTRANTQAIARAYLVEHQALEVIINHFKVSRQNVFRAVHTILNDAEIAFKTIENLKPVYRKLRLKNGIHELAHPFFFTEDTLEKIATTLKVDVMKILCAARYVIKKFKYFSTRDDIKEREAEFNKYLQFARIREKSIEIAYDHLVLNDSLTEVAKKHGITPQNAYNIMRRFKEAEQRYHDQVNNKPPTTRKKL